METFNQELAIKIFDYFFLEKHKVNGFVIFSREREVDHQVDHQFAGDFRNAFGIDVIIDDLINREYIQYSLLKILDNTTLQRIVSNFYLIEQDPDQVSFIIQNHFKLFSPDRFPDFMKAAIVKTCIDNQMSTMTGVMFLDYEGIIPKTKSLEELAIMMELER